MLGKQIWKLLSDSTSIFTRILKAKYFLRRYFLDANLSHNPSYTWRSLLSTQSLLSLSPRWKIGYGTNINVWKMSWIRNLPSHKPSTSPPLHCEDLTVNTLLNPSLNSWNIPVIQNLFDATDVTAILSIPLFSRSRTNSRIWKSTVDGAYTVKIAYCLYFDLLLDVTPVRNNFYWNSIWQMQIPPRVRSFIWQLAHQCLPTRANLISHDIPCADSCVCCDLLAEAHLHLFFVCSKAVNS